MNHPHFKVLSSTKGMSKEAWLDLRRQGIGGSDAAALCGLSPFASPLSVYGDKLGLTEPKEETEAMRLGHILEPYVAQRFSQETGLKVQRKNAIIQSTRYPFMIGDLDRVVVGQKAGLEIKTTSLRTRIEEGVIPEMYQAQILHYLGTCGFDTFYLAVLVLGRGFHIYRVDRDEEAIQMLVQIEQEFWNNHVLKGIPPDPDGSEASAEIIRKLFPKSQNDSTIVSLSGKEDQLERILELDNQIKGLEKEAETLKQQVQVAIGAADGGKVGDYTAWWRTYTRSSIDTKRLEREVPSLVADYMKTASYRRFEIRKED